MALQARDWARQMLCLLIRFNAKVYQYQVLYQQHMSKRFCGGGRREESAPSPLSFEEPQLTQQE